MGIFEYVFIVFGTIFAISWIHRHSTNSKPAFLNDAEGRISPGKGTAWFTVTFGGLMFIAGLVSLATYKEPEMVRTGIVLMLFGGAIGGFMLPSLTSIHDVIWSDTSVEGASKLFGPTLGRKREKINWSEFESSGKTATDYWYLQTKDKRRIYWSYLYLGYDEFVMAIQRNCPNIDTSIFRR